MVPYDLFEAALRLDGPTLQNLDLLEAEDGQVKGSLMAMLDTCTSAGTQSCPVPCISPMYMVNETATGRGPIGSGSQKTSGKEELNSGAALGPGAYTSFHKPSRAAA